jgi:hypothetical protein
MNSRFVKSEGLMLQQLRTPTSLSKVVDLLHASEQVCVSESRVIERKFATSRLRL